MGRVFEWRSAWRLEKYGYFDKAFNDIIVHFEACLRIYGRPGKFRAVIFLYVLLYLSRLPRPSKIHHDRRQTPCSPDIIDPSHRQDHPTLSLQPHRSLSLLYAQLVMGLSFHSRQSVHDLPNQLSIRGYTLLCWQCLEACVSWQPTLSDIDIIEVLPGICEH